jgi:hypothetical protein
MHGTICSVLWLRGGGPPVNDLFLEFSEGSGASHPQPNFIQLLRITGPSIGDITLNVPPAYDTTVSGISRWFWSDVGFVQSGGTYTVHIS